MAGVAELTPSFAEEAALDPIDRELVVATQSGLPLVPRPYHLLAEQLGIGAEEVMQRIQRMLERRIIRRIAAVPNHYALGFKANGMSVWDVPDARVSACGRKVGALDFVSHCYHRPRHPPIWNYNLFAMVHGRTRAEVEDQVAAIAALLGVDNHGHEILYSTRILKKTGLRLRTEISHQAS
jgi:DNA-binding Lrp family transcriptional regulator